MLTTYRYFTYWLFALYAGLLAMSGCRPSEPESFPLPTKICIRTQHHHVVIPHATVYIKYNIDTFPGYKQPASYFDKKFTTGADGRGCIEPVPEGRHCIIAFGYDSLYFPHDVFGSMWINIALGTHEVVDTTLFVSE